MPDWRDHLDPHLAGLRLNPEREAEIVEELSQHLDQRYEELCAGGAAESEARRLVLEELREPEALTQQMRSLRQAHVPPPITPGVPTGRVFAGLWQDLRYAARMLWKQPGFATVAALTLALGIGANTAIFSVVYGVLLKPLPEQGAATYFTYRESSRAFEDIALWNSEDVSITGAGEPERAQALRVTDGLLGILRVQPLLGRFFTRDDDAPGTPRRAILSQGNRQPRI